MVKSKRVSAAVFVVGFVLCAGAGYAFADHGPDESASETAYAKTADGRSIGTPPTTDAEISPQDFPDLVSVVADNGKRGFIESKLMLGPEPSSLQEAVEWEKNAPSSWKIPVYAADGKTIIGTFTIQGPARHPTVVTEK